MLVKYIDPKNKLSTLYEPNSYVDTKVYKQSATIKKMTWKSINKQKLTKKYFTEIKTKLISQAPRSQ